MYISRFTNVEANSTIYINETIYLYLNLYLYILNVFPHCSTVKFVTNVISLITNLSFTKVNEI